VEYIGLLVAVVAPRAGAWIEIESGKATSGGSVVAPRAGAWIEMVMIFALIALFNVAPRAGAWIEIPRYLS